VSHWRIVVHALDRTGPPVLARALLRWLSDTHPEHTTDVVAVRGGPMEEDLAPLTDVRVLLDAHAPGVPPEGPDRDAVTERLHGLPTAEATLLVSVAAAQALALLPPGPVATWSVEAGEDLHWLEGLAELRERTSTWLAGSAVTEGELSARLVAGTPVHLVPEFIERPAAADPDRRADLREGLGAGHGEHLVVGAGIATWRKAPDLFLEVALAHRRRSDRAARFTWIGGADDELHPLVRAEVRRLAPETVRCAPSVVDIDAHLAAADVLAHPARLDSFPLVCLHAAACGTPVAAFDRAGGVPEMFADAYCGAPYPDVTALADIVERLLADPAHRTEVAAAQQERVLQNFVADAAAPLVLEHLEAVRDDGGPDGS
jgi:glycosyltransferase involved in cell wall biosynthesis